jgi:lipoprotein-releasing system ATP-binding protein
MIVKINDICKSYGQLKVLKDINLEVGKSEVVSIVGASGAGKTTLLQIIGTLDKPDSGTVKLNGIDLTGLKSSKIAAFRNEHIGFIFQFHHLLPEFTALENVCIPGMIGKKKLPELKKKANQLFDYLNIAGRAQHKPSELSGGEQQRVAVARALINNPSIILADEPSGNLDSENARELHDLFFSLRKEFGKTLIIVTHNEELANMADRKLHMKDGEMEG